MSEARASMRPAGTLERMCRGRQFGDRCARQSFRGRSSLTGELLQTSDLEPFQSDTLVRARAPTNGSHEKTRRDGTNATRGRWPFPQSTVRRTPRRPLDSGRWWHRAPQPGKASCPDGPSMSGLGSGRSNTCRATVTEHRAHDCRCAGVRHTDAGGVPRMG